MKKVFFVDVTETYNARVEVQASSSDEAEEMVDELVGGGKVSIVDLALAGGAHTAYSKTSEAKPSWIEIVE